MDESQIISALQQNNQQVFKQLVDRYKNQIFNVCYGFVNDKYLADDLTQEVFTEVFLSIQYFNGKSKLSTWLYRIAVNKSIDYLRKQNRKKRWGQLWPITSTTENNAGAMVNQNPQSELENDERRAILSKAINKLPDQQKTAFTLNKYEDLSYQEIAEVMDTTVPAVESLLHRAKQNLRQQLEHYYKQNLK